MIDFEIKDPFLFFLSSLEDAGLIEITPQNVISIRNREDFLEFGFGLYLFWLHAHKRPRYPLSYFIPVDSTHTLFVVSPNEDSPYLIRPRGYRPGQLFLDGFEKCFPFKSDNCQFCDIRNSLAFNISFYSHTEAFKGFLSDKSLKKIQQEFPKKGDCKICRPNHFKWIKEKIIQEDKIGVCLGGYPALLNVSPKIFRILFSGPLEPSQLGQESIRLFDYFITVYLAEMLGSAKYTSNSRLTLPFSSFEIDAAILIEKDTRKNLLIIETTSYFHEYEKLKNKLLNYSALSRGAYNKFLYLYVTLAQGASVKLNKSIQCLDVNHIELGTLSSIMSNNDLVHIGLPPKFKDIDSFLQKDWWDKAYLRESFDYIIGTIEENAKPLLLQ